MPQRRKSPERRQRRGTTDLHAVTAEVVPFDGPAVPAASQGWLKATRDQWAEAWSSDLAGHFQATDMPALRRMFDWRDEFARTRKRAAALWREAEAEPLVDGSKGQPVSNGLFDVAAKLDAQALSIESRIVALEDRLGMSPKARLSLGVTVQHGINLAAQNASIAQRLREAMSDVSSSPDPRALPGDAAVDAF